MNLLNSIVLITILVYVNATSQMSNLNPAKFKLGRILFERKALEGILREKRPF